jgi:ferric-dicitrate binding protein FerR (iron transport regulator)
LAKHPPISESNDEDQPIAVITKMHYYGTDSSAIETSWTKNELVFNNERLDKIVLNLERWFKIKIIIKDESLKRERFTIPIKEEDKLKDVLDALKGAEGFDYSIKNKEVIINR